LSTALASRLEKHTLRVVFASASDFRGGHTDVAAFLRTHNCSVLVFDVAVPVGPCWDLLQALLLLREVEDLRIVVTTRDRAALHAAVGPHEALQLTPHLWCLVAVTEAIVAAATR
jgi:hypothetical protein